LDHTPGTAEVLKDIAQAVGGKITILADGGVRTGYDVLKMLALGADGVLVGRDIVRAAVGGGIEGVKIHLEYLQKTLVKAMLMTGCSDLASINQDILY
jgi:isopentenyl diphosphate isomerase/L-lactate dehydrogenase-like FMN-dependent dehydrogenase